VSNLRAKFEIFSFNGSRNMEGPKILKVGHVTPSRPLLT